MKIEVGYSVLFFVVGHSHTISRQPKSTSITNNKLITIPYALEIEISTIYLKNEELHTIA